MSEDSQDEVDAIQLLKTFETGLEHHVSLVASMDEETKQKAWQRWQALANTMKQLASPEKAHHVENRNSVNDAIITELVEHTEGQSSTSDAEIVAPIMLELGNHGNKLIEQSCTTLEPVDPACLGTTMVKEDDSPEATNPKKDKGTKTTSQEQDGAKGLMVKENFELPLTEGQQSSNIINPGNDTLSTSNHADHSVAQKRSKGLSARVMCHLCGKSLAHRSSLRTHQQIKHPEVVIQKYSMLSVPKKYLCSVCKAEFDNKEAVKNHAMSNHHMTTVHDNIIIIKDEYPGCAVELQEERDNSSTGVLEVLDGQNKSYKCKQCLRCFTTKNNAIRHEKTHSKQKPFSCEFCPKTFTEKASAKKHMQHFHAKEFKKARQALVCAKCGKICKNPTSLTVHMKSHNGLNTFTCKYCNYESNIKSNLVRHMKQHGRNKGAVCPYCRTGFSSKAELDKHLAKDHHDSYCREEIKTKGEDGRTCKICNKKFASKGNLTAHQWLHKGLKPFICDECGRAFAMPSNLKRHLLIHSGIKPWMCKDCGKKFAEKKTLETHHRTHTGEKPHKCHVCGKAFSQSSTLAGHMRIHLQQRRFSCDQCPKTFIQKAHLQLHQQRHCGNRTVSCPSCSKMFYRKVDMERHLVTHAEKRPFACTECHRTFTREQYLQEHMNIHEGKKPQKCKYCEQTFTDHAARYRHMKLHTAEYKPTRGRVGARNNSTKIKLEGTAQGVSSSNTAKSECLVNIVNLSPPEQDSQVHSSIVTADNPVDGSTVLMPPKNESLTVLTDSKSDDSVSVVVDSKDSKHSTLLAALSSFISADQALVVQEGAQGHVVLKKETDHIETEVISTLSNYIDDGSFEISAVSRVNEDGLQELTIYVPNAETG